MRVTRTCCFFFNDTATTEIYTLSLHDALPIYIVPIRAGIPCPAGRTDTERLVAGELVRSEEHTSELQSRPHLVCRLLLEKKNTDRHRAYRHQSYEPQPSLPTLQCWHCDTALCE